jgi:hypothetical protein
LSVGLTRSETHGTTAIGRPVDGLVGQRIAELIIHSYFEIVIEGRACRSGLSFTADGVEGVRRSRQCGGGEGDLDRVAGSGAAEHPGLNLRRSRRGAEHPASPGSAVRTGHRGIRIEASRRAERGEADLLAHHGPVFSIGDSNDE